MVTDEDYDNLKLNYVFLESRVTILEELIKNKDKKERKKKNKEVITLNSIKLDFIDSNPRERTDPFSDVELAMWATYILSKTSRKEIISSWPELLKRGKCAKKVVDFFVEKGLDEQSARYKTKEYLEMVLVQYPKFKGKDGEQNMNYFTATSDFAIGFYSQKMTNWKQVKNLPDESLD